MRAPTAPNRFTELKPAQTLDGDVLPGFSDPVAELFPEDERQ